MRFSKTWVGTGIVGGIVILALVWKGVQERPKTHEEASIASHQRMLEVLSKVSEASDDTNLFVGQHSVREARASVEKLRPDTPIVTRWKAVMELGVAEMNVGDLHEAISWLEAGRKICYQTRFEDAAKVRSLSMLAIAYFRLGENENCCSKPSPESCVYPLQGAALHARQEGSRKAIPILVELLQLPTLAEENRLTAVWLLNLAYMTLGEHPNGVPEAYRVVDARPTDVVDFPRFRNVAEAVGLDRYGLAGGVVIDDLNGDGWLDVLTTDWNPGAGIQLHLNNGDGTFAELTKEANLEGVNGGLNLKQADYDNDGDLDILVLRGAWLNRNGRYPNSLLRNEGANKNGTIRFTDVTFAVGLGEHSYPTQTADWADYDLDGDLDLFVGNEHDRRIDAPCQLFRNDGPGENGFVQFTEVGESAGVANRRFSKGISWGDYNGDRYPDLYVSNLRDKNRLYHNNGDGTFTDVAQALNVAGPSASFPVWFWDINNDGALDLFVSNYTGDGTVFIPYFRGEALDDKDLAGLYLGDGKGGFSNVVRDMNLIAPMLPMGSNYGDLNNDGFLDFYLGTGTPDYSSVVPNLVFLNMQGKRFEDVTVSAGMGHLQKGHSVSFADLDGDGDLDVFEQMGGAFACDPYYNALYENPEFGNRWLKVSLRGVTSNHFGVGARIRAVIEESGAERSVYRTLNSGGSFGANPLIAHLGLGQAKGIKRLEVFWPITGETQVLEQIPLDSQVVVTQGKESVEVINLKPFSLTTGTSIAPDQ